MNSVYGYARVSSADQDLTIQEEALRAAGCDTIRSEKISGTGFLFFAHADSAGSAGRRAAVEASLTIMSMFRS